MKLFSKIFFLIIIIFAFSVDSYSIVLHRDKRDKYRKNQDDNNKTLGDFYKKDSKPDSQDNDKYQDFNPDRPSKKRKVKLSKKYKPKMIIFNFENITKNPQNNYLVKLAAPSLTKKLKKSKKFNAEYVDIYFASVKIDDYSKYMNLLKQTSANYNADYVLTGFVHKPDRAVSIECLIYVTRSNSILKVNAMGNNLGVEYNDMIDELARKIMGLLKKENNKLQAYKGDSGYNPFKAFGDGKYKYFGMTGYFSLFYVRGLSKNIGYMASGVFYWELAFIKKIRNTKVARNLALFWSLDVGRIKVNFDVLDQSARGLGPMFHHFWGGVMGLMYKLNLKNIFVMDFGLGYGPMYSKTILIAYYQGVRNFLLPPESTQSTRVDHYFTMHFNFNIIVNNHFLFSFGISYHLISLEPTLFNALAGRAGIGIKF